MGETKDMGASASGKCQNNEAFQAETLPNNMEIQSAAVMALWGWGGRRGRKIWALVVAWEDKKFNPNSNVKRDSKRNIISSFSAKLRLFVFLGLIIYCLITSPLLLIAIAGSLGTCTYLSRRNTEKKIIIGGNEVSLVQQYTAVAVLSIPLFYIAGAGSILFWVLGASFFLIAIHATMYNIESVLGSDDEPFDLQMEEVG
ncbi:unnamed protein product, partial [Meganyctiphanes norvegica]